MSADISVFHSSEMDAAYALPEGWYVGAFRGNAHCEEATGPYPDERTAAIKMTTAGGCVWLHGDPTVGNYTWDRATLSFIIKPDTPILAALRQEAVSFHLRGSNRDADAPGQGQLF